MSKLSPDEDEISTFFKLSESLAVMNVPVAIEVSISWGSNQLEINSEKEKRWLELRASVRRIRQDECQPEGIAGQNISHKRETIPPWEDSMLVPSLPRAVLRCSWHNNEQTRCLAFDVEILHINYGRQLLRVRIPTQNIRRTIPAIRGWCSVAYRRIKAGPCQTFPPCRTERSNGIQTMVPKLCTHRVSLHQWATQSEMVDTRDTPGECHPRLLSLSMWSCIRPGHKGGCWYRNEFWEVTQVRRRSDRWWKHTTYNASLAFIPKRGESD